MLMVDLVASNVASADRTAFGPVVPMVGNWPFYLNKLHKLPVSHQSFLYSNNQVLSPLPPFDWSQPFVPCYQHLDVVSNGHGFDLPFLGRS
jgi:hypothetical protein